MKSEIFDKNERNPQFLFLETVGFKIWNESVIVFQIVDPAVFLHCVPDLVAAFDVVRVHGVDIDGNVVLCWRLKWKINMQHL